MAEDIFSKFQAEEEEPDHQTQNGLQISNRYDECEKEKFIDPPRELPKRSYSLEPDMVNGWKPKKNNNKINLNNVFSINYDQYVVDEIVKQLYKTKKKYKETLVYLGPRKNNSYAIHQNAHYQNPYPLDKKLEQTFSSRSGLPPSSKVGDGFLKFESDFQGGNLDVAIQRGSSQFDLFMRVDTNTRGHTNWFYFTVSNGDFIGTIQFNICNFRREKSLYQRGLKPYVLSQLHNSEWHQAANNVNYEKTKLSYECISQDFDQDFFSIQDQAHI